MSFNSQVSDCVVLPNQFPAGHCYLMTESLQKAYDAYQQALVNLRDPKVSTAKLPFIPVAPREVTLIIIVGPYAVVRNRYSL